MSTATPSGPPGERAELEKASPAPEASGASPEANAGRAEGPVPPAPRLPAAGPLLGEALRRASGRGPAAADTRELWARIEALEERREDSEALRAELERRRSTSAELERERDARDAEVAERDALIAELRQLIARTQDDVASVHAEQALLRNALAGARETITSEQSALEALRRNFAAHEEKVGARSAELAELRAEIERRGSEIHRLEQELAEARDEAGAARREASDLKRAVASHVRHIRRRDEEMAALRQSLAHLEEGGTQRDEELGGLRESLASARRCADAEQEQARRFREGLAAAERTLAERVRENADLREELTSLQRELAQREAAAPSGGAAREAAPARGTPAEPEPYELVEILRGDDDAPPADPTGGRGERPGDRSGSPAGGWKPLAADAAAEPVRAPGTSAPARMPVPDEQDGPLAEPPELPAIYHRWKRGQIREKLGLPGVETVDDFFLHYLIEACRQHPGETVPVVSVGTGSRDLEVVLARRALDAGVRNFNLHCLSPVPSGVSRPRAVAAEHTVLDHLTLVQCSGEAWPLEPSYRLCILNDSLHRLDNPEAWIDRVLGSLSPGGRVVASGPIGDADRSDAPVAQEIVAQIWQLMPERYRATRSDAGDPPRAGPGARAPAILPLLLDAFHFEVFAAFGNVIHAFVDPDIGPNFDPDRDRDRRFIEQVAALDDAKIDAGLIPPTQMLTVLRAEPVERPTVFRHWTPAFCLGREAPPTATPSPGPDDADAPRA